MENRLGMGTKKEPHPLLDGAQIGDDILSRAFGPVPSALVSLTSLFGMGRGGPHRNSHLKSWIRFDRSLDKTKTAEDRSMERSVGSKVYG